ncbi:hypothetical protein CRENBAI_014001 [Crenichthys baileyi]|uniref:Uncharacterized protein n=1 Tax=Crenichthys baileyi TaxID=28760 RepID=A0AAV9SBP0_9TELE
MTGSCLFFPRLFVMICAPVLLTIMCSHAVRASPTVPIVQKRVKYSTLRRLYPAQQFPSLAGLLFKESEVQTPADTLSISNHQSHPVPFTQGSFSYSQNSLDKTQPRVRITKVQRSEMRPASSIFTTHSLYRGQSFDKSRIPKNTLPQKEENTGNLYNSKVNMLKYPKKPGSEGEIWTSHSSKLDEDASARKLYSVFPSQTGSLPNAQPQTLGIEGSEFMEKNLLPTIRVWSGATKMQPSKVIDFTSQTQNRAESLGNSLSVIKRNPSHEKSPIDSKFPLNRNPISSEKMLEPKNIQSYLFKDSPSQVHAVTGSRQEVFRGASDAVSWTQKQSPSGAQEKSRFISNFNHFTRTDPSNQEFESQIDFSRPQVRLYPTPHKVLTPTRGFLHTLSAEDKNQESLVSVVDSHSQDSRKTFASLDQVNAISRELTQDYKPRHSIKRIHHLNRQKPVEMPGSSSSDRTQSSLDKGKDFRFGFSKNYPYSSQKYSFGQRKASATTTTPAKPDRMETNSPSSVTQVSRTSTAQPFTSTLMGPQDETGARIDRNASENRFRLYKGRFGLKGFGSQPLEGANALPLSADTSIAPKPSFKGFELRNSEISRPKRIRIHRWHNHRDETEPGNSGDFKTPPSTARGAGSVQGFKSNHTTIQVQTYQGFQPSKNRTVRVRSRTSWNYSEQNPLWLTEIASSSYLGLEGRQKDQMSPSPMPRTAKENRPATEEGAWFKTPTSSTVRGKRVKLVQTGGRKLIGPIVRNSTSNSVIRRPPRVKAVTYEDILGSASFSSVRAPGHQGHFPNMTIGEEEGWSSKSDGVKNMSRSPEANVINEKKDRESVERKEEADNEVETSDLFFESEGSGSFDLSNVLLTATEEASAGNDLLELDYLRKSTGNISFKSLSKSHLEQR